MFGLKSIFNILDKNKKEMLSLDKIASILHTNKEALEEFEKAYQKKKLQNGISDNLFEVSAKEASSIRKNAINIKDIKDIDAVINKIVDELLAQTETMVYDGKKLKVIRFNDKTAESKDLVPVSNTDLATIPIEQRPQLTGSLLSVDILQPSYIVLLDYYFKFLNEKDDLKKKRQYYGMFRRGLDMLDLDSITYDIIGTNRNSIGYWFPKIIDSFIEEGFFKIPKTSIIKVPLTLLQLTRKDYNELTPATIKIVDKYCKKAFDLNTNNDYFIKTGTYSSKFDFRNAHVTKGKEVTELGEYLLYIHYQALCMAHYDLSGRNQPSIYGVSTTNEWCVREYIEDKDDRPTIYNGLHLHTEYRAFVDFDKKEVLGIHNYWDSKVMKDRFSKHSDADTIQMKHDYVTFSSCSEDINREYEKNKNTIISHLESVIKDVNLTGQWSIDIMQNSNDFYIIDMAQADNSAYYKETVPFNKRIKSEEDWIPKISI